MTLNLFGIDNKTEYSFYVQNRNDTKNSYSVPPHSFIKHDAWLGDDDKATDIYIIR
ncbi:hypothetical protein HZS38_01715 [Xenorhabdus nematophila]|uniref:hypothetical protein n=1 Tax=Xenorhabdus nematophila TaxID=628 RepID=UPI0005422586|nr:hypothetical protein [Xenorhabdus nematophila]MBA0017975.1 hypothetical protein [Xenorhabdus nematophila]MCB4427091.1 hypothetical protein [Xenorhabdus nematophila]QNJ37060.1 hypothetical protein H8F46_02010 [Xenorhabdus nematophila]CEF31501.1 hypothetical protein XNW1_3810002 [Xenorhabdus nematophila str. Websteri]